jgi:hypothetical protein
MLHQCVEYDVYHPEGLERPDCVNYTLHEVTDLSSKCRWINFTFFVLLIIIFIYLLRIMN